MKASFIDAWDCIHFGDLFNRCGVCTVGMKQANFNVDTLISRYDIKKGLPKVLFVKF